jgi:hypothetical protein
VEAGVFGDDELPEVLPLLVDGDAVLELVLAPLYVSLLYVPLPYAMPAVVLGAAATDNPLQSTVAVQIQARSVKRQWENSCTMLAIRKRCILLRWYHT